MVTFTNFVLLDSSFGRAISTCICMTELNLKTIGYKVKSVSKIKKTEKEHTASYMA